MVNTADVASEKGKKSCFFPGGGDLPILRFEGRHLKLRAPKCRRKLEARTSAADGEKREACLQYSEKKKKRKNPCPKLEKEGVKFGC